MEKCSLCEAPPEPGKKLCKHHLLQQQEWRASLVEKVWEVVKKAPVVVTFAIAVIGIFKSSGGNSKT
jgi:hypothetical protein